MSAPWRGQAREKAEGTVQKEFGEAKDAATNG